MSQAKGFVISRNQELNFPVMIRVFEWSDCIAEKVCADWKETDDFTREATKHLDSITCARLDIRAYPVKLYELLSAMTKMLGELREHCDNQPVEFRFALNGRRAIWDHKERLRYEQ